MTKYGQSLTLVFPQIRCHSLTLPHKTWPFPFPLPQVIFNTYQLYHIYITVTSELS